MPRGRTTMYLTYRACERFKINPVSFSSLNRRAQYRLLSYERIRQKEETKEFEAMAMAGISKRNK